MSDKKVHGSIILSKSAISILLNSKASGLHIAGYVVLARFTHHEHDKFISSAGINALVNRLGIGRLKAKTLINDLISMEYNDVKLLNQYGSIKTRADMAEVLKPDQLIFKKVFSKYKFTKKTNRVQGVSYKSRRWIMNSGGKEVWIDDTLIGCGRDNEKPLRTLWKICGETCTRLLLYMYYHLDIDNGITDISVLYKRFNVNFVGTFCDIEILYCNDVDLFCDACDSLYRCVYGVDIHSLTESVKYKIKENLMSDLCKLEFYGFIERNVMVFTRDDEKETIFSYTLDIKGQYKYTDGEIYFCNKIDDVVGKYGYRLSRKDRKHYKEYYALAPENHGVIVAMVYKMRHRVINPNNYRISKARERKKYAQDQVGCWLAALSEGGPLEPGKPQGQKMESD